MCVGRSGRDRDSEQWLVVVTVLLEDLLMSDTERGGGDQRWRANQRPVYWSRDHSQPIRGGRSEMENTDHKHSDNFLGRIILNVSVPGGGGYDGHPSATGSNISFASITLSFPHH